MKNLYALTRREAGALFLTPSLYAVTAFFVLLYGFGFWWNCQVQGTADLSAVARIVCFLSLLLVPLITMRSFAGEAASGTIEMLLTAPVSPGEVVLSKFLGCYAFYLATLLPCGAYVLMLARLGDVDRGAAATTVAALCLCGALFTAVGILVSSLTVNLIVAAAIATGGNFTLLMLDVLGKEDSPALLALKHLGFAFRLEDRLLKGVVDTRDLAYFLSFTACLLLLTWLVAGSRGAFSRIRGARDRRLEFLGGLCGAAALGLALFGAGWCHVDDLTGLDKLASFYKTEGAPALLWHAVPLCAAALCAAAALLLLFRSRGGELGESLATFARGQAGGTLLAAFSVIVIAVNLNILANQSFDCLQGYPLLKHARVLRYRNFDLSEGKANTLPVDTRKTLDELEYRLDIHVFYSRRIAYAENLPGEVLLEKLRKLLSDFSNYSPLVHVTYVDAQDNSDEARQYAQELGLDPLTIGYLAVLTYHDEARQNPRLPLPVSYLLKPPSQREQLAGIKDYTFNGEYTLTHALKLIMDPRVARAYFSAGKGEMSSASTQARPGCIGGYAELLRQNGFQTQTAALDDGVPPDCDLLVMAAPKVPIGKETAEAVEKYVDRGGRLLLLLPPVELSEKQENSDSQDDEDLMRLVAGWGGRPRADVIYDPRNCLQGKTSAILATGNAQHPVTSGGRSVICVLPEARSLRLDYKAEERGQWQVKPLLETSEYSVSTGMSDGKLKTRKGPFTAAFTAERKLDPAAPESRVAVIGCAGLADNLCLDYNHNKAFLLAAAQWLTGKDYRIRVEPRDYVDRSLNLTGRQLRVIGWVSLGALPLAWLLLGALVWWTRKQ